MEKAKMAPRTYRIDTYGCQMNAHESEKISGMLDSLGLVPASENEIEDVRILNTCCIRDSAEQRIIGHIGTLKKLKHEKPDMVLAVVGCMSARSDAASKLRRTFPYIDIILGTSDITELPERISELLSLDVGGARVDHETVAHRNGGPLAFVNVMYGCDNFCSYCIVPYVRGRERSRDEDDILREITRLTSEGYREITLLGQNVNSYQGGGDRFAELLNRISSETSVDRIRFMTSHPKDMSPALIRALRDIPHLCAGVHLPVQSGSDKVLASMNRKYTRCHYLSLVDSLRTSVPGIVLTTDVIVGYPGESGSDFLDTISLMENVRFDAAYTFVYSPRTGTRAASLPDQVDAAEKKRRIMELVDLQNHITRDINAGYRGRIEEVLVEGSSARGTDMCGRTYGGKMVNFSGPESLVSELINVRITEARGTTLYGVIEESE